MAPKRKHVETDGKSANGTSKSSTSGHPKKQKTQHGLSLQIVAGSYDRVLHGIRAILTPEKVEFEDTFLFNAHTSAIRCLAISPSSSSESGKSTGKRILASGGTDERINLYNLSTLPARESEKPNLPTLAPSSSKRKVENPQNRELGSLLHHSRSLTVLNFTNRSKLLSAAEDNTIAISKTRDWTVLSTLKAPEPKSSGRPSGDTSPFGAAPMGVNDFAVHPSQKLMISVSKGEKCMRLWNLVTGKKAGVLSFERALLEAVGENKRTTGEGRRIAWNKAGTEFVIAFDRGAAVFGAADSKPKKVIVTTPRSRVHQVRYLPGEGEGDVLNVSTEDGRVVFFDTQSAETLDKDGDDALPQCKVVGELRNADHDISGRIKDYKILEATSANGQELYLAAAGSDGTIALWSLDMTVLRSPGEISKENGKTPEAGKLLGGYQTGNRITCLDAFVMDVPGETVEPESNGVDLVGNDDENEDEEEEGDDFEGFA